MIDNNIDFTGLVARGDKAINERYRPCTFHEIIGNDKTKKSLAGWMEKGNKRSAALLLHGASGCCKTTTARILAMGLNCEQGDTVNPCCQCPSCKSALAGNAMHITEYNMSALSKKEDADEIVNSMYNSSFTGRNNVYIMDQCQGMSSSSQNLMLKTPENPPANTYVILCLSKGTKVSTNNGIKNIEDIKINDMVQTHNGFEKVTMSQLNGIKQTYKISTKYNSIVATSNHPICVLQDDKLIWKNVSDICVGDVVPIYNTINTDKGISLSNKECEFLGRMVGDGYWNKKNKHYHIGILFNLKEYQYGEELMNQCGLSFKGYIRKNVKEYTIHCKNGSALFWNKFGLSEYQNGHKTFPKIISHMSDQQFRNFFKRLE